MRGNWLTALRVAVIGLALAALGPATAAASNLSDLLAVPACTTQHAAGGTALPYAMCDDGSPTSAGGTTANATSSNAIAVPAKYAGATGLPPKAVDAATVPGANPAGDIALDVDVSLPNPAANPMPPGGYPIVVMMHGCCGGSKGSWERQSIDSTESEMWHYNNAWFAARGYVVLNYTARGFVDGNNHGSTGQTQLDSDLYEINDYQHLVGQLVDRADIDPLTGGNQVVNPSKVVVTGGSYGGGFTWMALTDPTWSSPGGKSVRLAAVAPKYGWTNLVEALVPNGLDPRDGLPTTDPAKAGDTAMLGYPKRSILAGLYATGKGVPGQSHATFPPDVDAAQVCLNSPDPYELNPTCTGTVSGPNNTLQRFLAERSAYLENGFFAGLAGGTIAPVPVFSAGTFTDPLFPPAEHRRMVERLKATVPGYPVQEYYGDYQHFVQNKAKEWGDLCGSDHHLCRYADYPGGNLNTNPPALARDTGATTRLNRFIDFYAKPPGNAGQSAPAFDVTASLQICPKNAGGAFPLSEPGQRFTASSFGALTQGSLTISARGAQSTTFSAGANPHAKNADPVANQTTNGKLCPVENSSGGFATAGPGVATYDSVDLPREFVMIGRTRLSVTHVGAGDPRMLAARLYDLYPDGTQVMVDRGVRRLTAPSGTTVLDLHGNGWRFPKGHRVRIEIAQDDDPYIKSSNLPGSLSIAAAKLELPIRGASASLRGFAPPTGPRANLRVPRLASDQGTSSRIRLRLVAARKADKRFIARYQLELRRGASKRFRRVSSRIRKSAYRLKTRLGQTYTLRARAVDRRGHAGPWDTERTITPLDDGRRMGVRSAAGWSRKRARRAFGKRLSRSARRGVRFRFRFRGDRVYLVGRKSRFGGKALVRLGRKRKVISFYSRKTRNRTVVWKARAKRRGVNRLRVVVLGRGRRGRRVEIDGIAFRRI